MYKKIFVLFVVLILLISIGGLVAYNQKKLNQNDVNGTTREEIAKQAEKIKEEVYAIQFPTTTKSNYDSYPYTFSWDRKPINRKGEKIRLLFILPWFKVGGADKFNLDLISRLDKNKFDITIVTTENSDYVWRQKFEKYIRRNE